MIHREHCREPILDIRLTGTDDKHVARASSRTQRIDVEASNSLLERIHRIARIILGPEQTLLLGGPEREHNRALRTGPRSEHPRELEHRGDSSAVVDSANVNGIT